MPAWVVLIHVVLVVVSNLNYDAPGSEFAADATTSATTASKEPNWLCWNPPGPCLVDGILFDVPLNPSIFSHMLKLQKFPKLLDAACQQTTDDGHALNTSAQE